MSMTPVRHIGRPFHTIFHPSLGLLLTVGLLLGLLAPLLQPSPTYGAAVISAAFTEGGFLDPTTNTRYTKQGQALTLTVTTSSDTRCVIISGDHAATQTSTSGQASWTFTFTAGTGDGGKAVMATAYANDGCSDSPGSGTASYILDNTGPVLTASLSPTPNAAGWHKSNVTISWSASDSGAGVGSGPTPATERVTANGIVAKTATALDRLGNPGSSSVTVKLDKEVPSITASRAPAANTFGWNNSDVSVSFTCADQAGLSGINSCPAPIVLSSEGASQAVSGTALDHADNSAGTTVSGINIDKTAPSLRGVPTTVPNAAGWYQDDVTIEWLAQDELAGIDPSSVPLASVITGEGNDLGAGPVSVFDQAGNETSAAISGIKIDRTNPAVTIISPATGARTSNESVIVSVEAVDLGSGVASVTINGVAASPVSGTTYVGRVALTACGPNTMTAAVTDQAGRQSAAQITVTWECGQLYLPFISR